MSLMVTLWGVTKSQSPNCAGVIASLLPCLGYITGKTPTPTPDCCTKLSSAVDSKPHCLCEIFSGPAASFGAALHINETLALALPGACKIQTPPISKCNVMVVVIMVVVAFIKIVVIVAVVIRIVL
ncbi:PREDICTED: non-specific lipid transfer protein GPI-anchored 2-like [Lupinus angustifolius]|uniref:non-specific lipid transfer protein GPI-anchored 2-like n=1 Tax=Lupinus angustifolius TaxID=3871 RepID=UPI00092E2309|nr:PREDICTED: non-specific lipid transfer protein GPI-anchored 2-like [Lupinus angustifolius]